MPKEENFTSGIESNFTDSKSANTTHVKVDIAEIAVKVDIAKYGELK